MKRAAFMAASALVIAVAVHILAVWATPRIVMHLAMSKIAEARQYNTIVNAPLATDKSRTIVRPSPDLAYSACVLDLSGGPVRLGIPVTAPYTSLSLYSSATDNYFVRDDRAAGAAVIDVLVVGPGGEAPADLPASTIVVEAPVVRGIAVVRRVVEDIAALPAIDSVREHSACAPRIADPIG